MESQIAPANETMATLVEQTRPNDDTRYSQYDRFAPIYNRLFGRFAHRVYPALDRLLLQHLPPQAHVLDVCCGTGQLARLVEDNGSGVTGIDGSSEMLRLARKNAPNCNFILDDVRGFKTEETFHAAVSTFDSLNHITDEDDLAWVMRSVYESLKPGSSFVFDMNMEECFLSRWWGKFTGREGGEDFTIKAEYCAESRLGRNIVTLRPIDGRDESNITFVERCYSESEICEALSESGFTNVEVFDGQRDLELMGEVGRSFFVCRKPAAVRNRIRTPETTQRVGRQPIRTCETCIADRLWPSEAAIRELGDTSQRFKAIDDVLRTLPTEPYNNLKHRAHRFKWFAPGDFVFGQVFPFAINCHSEPPKTNDEPSRLVYLSPLLEQHDPELAVAVVVHELAHIIFDHQLLGLDEEKYRQQEAEARQGICSWGFQKELHKTEAVLQDHFFAELFD